MDQNQSLFSLSIDPVTKANLSETAKWARFLAIIGMIGVVLLVVGGVFYSIWITSMMQSMSASFGGQTPYGGAVGIGAAVMFVIVAVIIFFPFLYMLRFANKMKRALVANDQESLNYSFQNLKIYFRYLGIITIISLVLWILWIVIIASTAVF